MWIVYGVADCSEAKNMMVGHECIHTCFLPLCTKEETHVRLLNLYPKQGGFDLSGFLRLFWRFHRTDWKSYRDFIMRWKSHLPHSLYCFFPFPTSPITNPPPNPPISTEIINSSHPSPPQLPRRPHPAQTSPSNPPQYPPDIPKPQNALPSNAPSQKPPPPSPSPTQQDAHKYPSENTPTPISHPVHTPSSSL